MGTRDPRIDAYIEKSADFAKPILTRVRELLHKHCPDANETIKWGFPHFEYKGDIFCGVAAFKAHCAFGFWRAKMMKIEGKSDDAMGQFGCIKTVKDLPTSAAFAKLIKEAMALHDAGVKAPVRAKTEKKELDIPPYFMAAVKKNKKALATFEGFSYTNKKEYVTWITEAKAEATRDKRLAQAVEWMAEGKTRNWKYMNC